MHHLMIGYGYCGYYLTQKLMSQQQQVTTLARSDRYTHVPGVHHLTGDITQACLPLLHEPPVLYYLAPPPPTGDEDSTLKAFLAQNQLNVKKVIYFSTTGVYGNQNGAWVDENTPCSSQNGRERRRVDAEQQWHRYCVQHNIPLIILRVAGIYGPQRLPHQAVIDNSPLIFPDEAPWTNHIFINDLVNIAAHVGTHDGSATVINCADGIPTKMGALAQIYADQINHPYPPYDSYEHVFAQASSMKQAFMASSKKVAISHLKHYWPEFTPTALAQGVRLSLEIERKSVVSQLT